MESNRIIAHFMGLRPKMESPDVYTYNDGLMFTVREDNPEKVMEAIVRYAKYHNDWNWLMPVLDKIEKNGATIRVNSNFNHFHKSNFHQVTIEIDNGELSKDGKAFYPDGYKYKKHSNTSVNKMEVFYSSVIDFIKWYNENK